MLTTVVVTTRERYSVLIESLRSLFNTIPRDTRVIVFDCNAPEAIRQQLRDLNAQRPFDLHETDQFHLAPEVRNLALPLVTSKYVCFCDNDVFFEQGWLSALERNAEQHKSAAVAPLVLIGPTREPLIHHAGGEVHFYRDKKGRNRLHSQHRLGNKLLSDAVANDYYGLTIDCHEFEYHCVLLHTETMRGLRGHDEHQVKHDHLHDSLRLLASGHRITFEAESVVSYQAFLPFKSYDWPYFFYRWSNQDAARSESLLAECWNARKNAEQRALTFTKMHHLRCAANSTPSFLKAIWPSSKRKGLDRAFLRYLKLRYPPVRPTVAERYQPSSIPAGSLMGSNIRGVELLVNN